ncbi:MAG: recombination mediator RecR, partial [Patescibacteria group bacterium]
FPLPIQKLISHFQKLPGIGPRQAAKFALRLTKMADGELASMAADMANLKSSIGECKECFLLFDRPKTNQSSPLCQYCRDEKRDKNKICVVVSDHDALTIEKTKTFDGVYHVLGGNISLLDKKENAGLSVSALKDRILSKQKEKLEVILAMNATAEGQATAIYIEKIFSDSGIKITRLAQGLSTGSEIEYADDQTLINALKHRR